MRDVIRRHEWQTPLRRVMRPAAGIASLAFILLAAFAVPPARAQPVSGRPSQLVFDPATCARDPQGMVHFAVNRRVYRQPAGNLLRVAGREPETMKAFPIPPRPDEPEGCPDHPIQGAVFHFRPFSALPDDPQNPAPRHADAFHLVINGGTFPDSANGSFTLFCQRSQPGDPKLRDTSIPGMIGCTIPGPVPNFSYQATEYESSDGTKVAVTCLVDNFSGSRDQATCRGGYRLYDDFVLNFNFSTQQLAINDFIAADGEVRRRIEAAEIRNYPWQRAPGAEKR